MLDWAVLEKFLAILFKTLIYLAYFCTVVLSPLTGPVKIGMLLLVLVGVPLLEAWLKRRREHG